MATKWGIISTGKISFDFVGALRSLPREEHALVAVAARDVNRAQEFAKEHGIQKAYGDYLSLAQDPDVEVAYVGNLMPDHFPVSKLLLENGKNVVCEKSMCMNAKEVKILVDLAKKKNLFIMEAVWSRFFPAYAYVKEQIKSGAIGDVLQVTANFGVPISQNDRISQKALGGGSVLDLGVYTLQFANFILGPEAPKTVKAVGHLNADGVDLNMAAVLSYSGNRTAVISCNSQAKLHNEAYVHGTEGYIKIPDTFWCPIKVVVNDVVKEFPLPESKINYKHTNSAGLMYEAMEVRRCLKAGLKESPLMSVATSLQLAELEDEVRKQIGVVYPQDSQ